jgi:hypothetical protein
MKTTKLAISLALIISSIISTFSLMASVTQVKVGVSPKSHSGMCPKKFEFGAKIFVDKAGSVTYKWVRSDGAESLAKTITFDRPSSKKVFSSWTQSKPGTYWQVLQILSPNPTTSKKATFTLNCFPLTKIDTTIAPPKLPSKLKKGQIPPEIFKSLGPDPSAHEIKFEIVERYSQFKGKIRVTGIVMNIGPKTFQASPQQAKAILYELPSGVQPEHAPIGKIVDQKEFTSLAPKETLELTYELDWNSSPAAQGAFPTSYRLLIKYDPIIFKDDNPNNDDCNRDNNKKNRSGMWINKLLQ